MFNPFPLLQGARNGLVFIYICILFQVYLKDRDSALVALDCTCVHISCFFFFVFYSSQTHSCTCVDALIDVLFFSWFVGVSLTKNHLYTNLCTLKPPFSFQSAMPQRGQKRGF